VGLVGVAAGFAILLTMETVFVLMSGLFLGTAVPKKFMLAGFKESRGSIQRECEGGKNVVVDSRGWTRGGVCQWLEKVTHMHKESLVQTHRDAASTCQTPACRVPAILG
jgi:hypothetical protein